MNFSDITARRRFAGVAAGCLLGGIAAATIAAPNAAAAPDCSAGGVSNPGEYYDLKGILAPIGDTQRQCNVSVLPADLASAYNEFMAG